MKTRQVQARCTPNQGQKPPAGKAEARLTRAELEQGTFAFSKPVPDSHGKEESFISSL